MDREFGDLWEALERDRRAVGDMTMSQYHALQRQMRDHEEWLRKQERRGLMTRADEVTQRITALNKVRRALLDEDWELEVASVGLEGLTLDMLREAAVEAEAAALAEFAEIERNPEYSSPW